MDKWQSEARHSRIKIKNAVRIIDFRIEDCLEMKREMELRKTPYEKISPEVLRTGTNLAEKMVEHFQQIRDELIPEEKS